VRKRDTRLSYKEKKGEKEGGERSGDVDHSIKRRPRIVPKGWLKRDGGKETGREENLHRVPGKTQSSSCRSVLRSGGKTGRRAESPTPPTSPFRKKRTGTGRKGKKKRASSPRLSPYLQQKGGKEEEGHTTI